MNEITLIKHEYLAILYVICVLFFKGRYRILLWAPTLFLNRQQMAAVLLCFRCWTKPSFSVFSTERVHISYEFCLNRFLMWLFLAIRSFLYWYLVQFTDVSSLGWFSIILLPLVAPAFCHSFQWLNHLESVMGNLIHMYAEIVVVCLAQSSNNYIISAWVGFTPAEDNVYSLDDPPELYQIWGNIL